MFAVIYCNLTGTTIGRISLPTIHSMLISRRCNFRFLKILESIEIKDKKGNVRQVNEQTKLTNRMKTDFKMNIMT